jgi:hypothetical protein
MRRMVTNERQRKYATEMRKNSAAAKAAQEQGHRGSATPAGGTPQPDVQSDALSITSVIDIDPKLNQYHYNIQSPAAQEQPQGTASPPKTAVKSVFAKKAAELEGIKYHVSIMQESRRVMPRFTLNPNTCPSFSSLVQHLDSVMDDDGREVSGIKVLGPGGLVDVKDESSWVAAIEAIKQNEWMDGELRCVVQVE